MFKKYLLAAAISIFGIPAFACPGTGNGSQGISTTDDTLFGDDIYGADALVYQTEANGEHRGTECGGAVAYNWGTLAPGEEIQF